MTVVIERDARPVAGPLFWLLAFVISWAFWFVEPALRTSDPLAARLLVMFGSCGPAIAAVIARRVTRQPATAAPWWQRLAACAAALAVGVFAGWGDVAALFAYGGSAGHWILMAASVVIPAILVAILYTGRAARPSAGRPRAPAWAGFAWWAAALLVMPVLHLAGWCLEALFGGPPLPHAFAGVGASDTYRNLLRALPATALWGGPVGEEAGWRGFALPRLQHRFDPLLASVILGAAWGAWHLPLHLTGYYDAAFGSPLLGLVMRAFTTVPLTVLFTWLFNRTGGSVPAMVLLHTAVNVSSGLSTPGWGMFAATAVAVVLVVVLDRMYRKESSVPA